MTTVPVLKSGSIAPSSLGLPTNFNFLNPLDALPYQTGLVGAYMFGGSSLDGSCFNFANPDLPLTVVGSPVISAVGAAVNNHDGFYTGILETLSFSVLSVVQAQTSGFSALRTYPLNGVLVPYGMSLNFSYSVAHCDPVCKASSKGVAIGQGFPQATVVGNLGTTSWCQLFGRADDTSVDVSGQLNNTRWDGTTAMTDGGRGTSEYGYYVGAAEPTNASAGTSCNVLAAFIWNNKMGDTDRNNTLSALRTWFNTGSGLGITTL